MKQRLNLLTVAITPLLLVGSIEAEDIVAFLVGGDPQYLAEKSASPTRLDPFSEQAAVRMVQLLKQFPGRDIPQQFGGGRTKTLSPNPVKREYVDDPASPPSR